MQINALPFKVSEEKMIAFGSLQLTLQSIFLRQVFTFIASLIIGHDNGVMVFKLERERPAYTIHQNTLLFVTKDKFVRSFDIATSTESSNLISLRKLGQPWNPPRSISYNPADRSVLVSSSVDGGVYELVNLPRDNGSVVDGSEAKKGRGTFAVWVACNG